MLSRRERELNFQQSIFNLPCYIFYYSLLYSFLTASIVRCVCQLFINEYDDDDALSTSKLMHQCIFLRHGLGLCVTFVYQMCTWDLSSFGSLTVEVSWII